MAYTRSEENYLKEIYHLGGYGSKNVSTNALAARLKTKASSVTDMIQKLSEKNVVAYVKYKGVRLTEEGREVAIRVIRKHRLWEVFLVEKLNFSWDQVHDVAEQLEHVRSEKLTNELDAFLGFPTHDPHGDPIPDTSGKIKVPENLHLSEVGTGSDCVCVGVKDSSADFLKYLNKKNIALGTHFTIVETEAFDQSMTIDIEDTLTTISGVAADNLYVKVL